MMTREQARLVRDAAKVQGMLDDLRDVRILVKLAMAKRDDDDAE